MKNSHHRRLYGRRTVLKAASGAPLAVAAACSGPEKKGPLLPAPRYILSGNTEIMFPEEMPRAQRIERIAAAGLTAFSFWAVPEKEEGPMLAAQQRTGLACGSIAGSGRIGWETGLTATGHADAYFEVIRKNCEVAKRFGTPNLVIFAGEVQKDIPWETQYRQIIGGLRQAGDIAAEYGVYLCLEPLNPVYAPQMSVLSARLGFEILEEVGHPHVKLDFDIYHLQLGEGNLIENLKLGLEKGWIQFVEIGDVPGRLEPGTGEINYGNIFKTLREAGYEGFVGMEHGTSSTPEAAMRLVKDLAGVA